VPASCIRSALRRLPGRQRPRLEPGRLDSSTSCSGTAPTHSSEVAQVGRELATSPGWTLMSSTPPASPTTSGIRRHHNNGERAPSPGLRGHRRVRGQRPDASPAHPDREPKVFAGPDGRRGWAEPSPARASHRELQVSPSGPPRVSLVGDPERSLPGFYAADESMSRRSDWLRALAPRTPPVHGSPGDGLSGRHRLPRCIDF
jgi:hypothetical protein